MHINNLDYKFKTPQYTTYSSNTITNNNIAFKAADNKDSFEKNIKKLPTSIPHSFKDTFTDVWENILSFFGFEKKRTANKIQENNHKIENQNSDSVINNNSKKQTELDFSPATDEEFELYQKELLNKLKKNNVQENKLTNIEANLDRFNIKAVNLAFISKKFDSWDIDKLTASLNRNNISLFKKLFLNKNFNQKLIPEIMSIVDEKNISLAEKLCFDESLPEQFIEPMLNVTNKSEENIKTLKTFAIELSQNKDLNPRLAKDILYAAAHHNIKNVKELYNDNNISKDRIPLVIDYINNRSFPFIKKFVSDKSIPGSSIIPTLMFLNLENSGNLQLAEKLFDNHDFPNILIKGILKANIRAKKEDDLQPILQHAIYLYTKKKFNAQEVNSIIEYTTKDNLGCCKRLCERKDIPRDKIPSLLIPIDCKFKADFTEELLNNKKVPIGNITSIVIFTNEDTIDACRELCKMPETVPAEIISSVISVAKNNPAFLPQIISISQKILEARGFDSFFLEQTIHNITPDNYNFALEILSYIKEGEISSSNLDTFLEKKIELSEYFNLADKIGIKNCLHLTGSELQIAISFIEYLGKDDHEQLTIVDKKALLSKLISFNSHLFSSDFTRCNNNLLRKLFPLLPKNQKEYCELLPRIVKSISIETKPLNKQDIDVFKNSLNILSLNIAKLSDEDFNNLKIKQKYSKTDFIQTALDKTKNLTVDQRKKVFNYFNFDIKTNPKAESGFSISGYPNNYGENKNKDEFSSSKVQDAITGLNKDVDDFINSNPITTNYPQFDDLLNTILNVLPELRTTIGKSQHSTHAFDVFKHSLKVFQKISQSKQFANLSHSDKNVILLAALLHDITKFEGQVDKTHAKESSFDSFFITKKLQLSKKEEMKLYKLIKYHEWAGLVSNYSNEKELNKNLQSVAFDLQQDNLLNLSLLFTHADLKAIKANDNFHDNTKCKYIDDTIKSCGQLANCYAKKIHKYREELKNTQPLLPVTKFPSADVIKSNLVVNKDGTTNIKGVYVDNDGLVIIKYNEVQDWEEIGFPKGTISRGITSVTNNTPVNTGNIKFFVHGLDNATQLSKVDTFSLVDSDALLSVSYAERPESKFRFFRTQGVILDADTDCVYGGGCNDSGSGCGKNIDVFKENYIFGGEREEDRNFVSNLIKEATGMDDKEYRRFVTKYKNKSMTEIEPALRKKIIDAFATINSNTRRGDRSYNEFYISNPTIMGVFAYPYTDSNHQTPPIQDPVGFVNNNEKFTFLKDYALNKNVPFILFGH